MFIEIDDETADKITICHLKNCYESTFEVLKKTLSQEDFVAAHSFDFDEEVFALIRELKAYELIISNFDGYIKTTVDVYLKEVNESIYISEKTFQDLKSENEMLKNKNHILEEELNELKNKIKCLII